MYTIIALLALAAAYVLGSLPGALVLAPVFDVADPRAGGSGNAGATNALRVGGPGYGAAVLCFDLLKGVLAVIGIGAVVGAGSGLAFALGAAVVIGHIAPVFFGFRGGKGAATVAGVLLALVPGALLVGAAVWIAALVASGFAGLATVLAMGGVALACLVTPSAGAAAKIFTVAMAALIVLTHRDNIRRMRAGTEPRLARALWPRRR